MNLLKRFLGYAPKVGASPGLLPPRTVPTLTDLRRMRMTVAPKCPPGYSPQWLNGRFAGCSKLPSGLGAPVGLGAADWTNAALIAAASALSANLAANGCQPVFVQEVHDFQQAYTDAGGVLPQDSGNRSPIDGLYGNNTAAALRESDPNAPAGCVGAGAAGGAPAAGGGTALSTTPSGQATLFSSMFDGSSSFFGLPSGYWVLGLVGLAVAAVVINPKPGRAAPRRLSRKARSKRRGKRKAKRSKRGKRSARRGKKKSKRRRNPILRVGDIYAGTWGFNESHPAFFKITRMTAKTIFGRFLVEKPSGEFNVVPTQEMHGKERRATPTKTSRPGLKVGHIYLFEWDGRPMYRTPANMGNEAPKRRKPKKHRRRKKASDHARWASPTSSYGVY